MKQIRVRRIFVLIAILSVIVLALAILIIQISPPRIAPVGVSGINVLVVPGIKEIVTPDPDSLNQVAINHSMKITVELTTPDNHMVLSQLPGSYGRTDSSLQHLLGDHNTACIDASLDVDSDLLNVEPSQAQEYPLNQTSIIWTWIVTPKHTGVDFFSISFTAAGKSACAVDKDPIVGPYSLNDEDVSYFFTTIDPNRTPTPTAIPTPTPATSVAQNPLSTPEATAIPSSGNIFMQTYNNLGIGTIITGALTTLLAAFITWICAEAWKRRKSKAEAQSATKAPDKPGPPSPPDNPGKQATAKAPDKPGPPSPSDNSGKQAPTTPEKIT